MGAGIDLKTGNGKTKYELCEKQRTYEPLNHFLFMVCIKKLAKCLLLRVVVSFFFFWSFYSGSEFFEKIVFFEILFFFLLMQYASLEDRLSGWTTSDVVQP